MATQHDKDTEERRAFVAVIEGYLARGESQNAFEEVHDLRNYETFKNSGFELIPVLGKYVTGQAKIDQPDSFKCAQQILERISIEFCPQETYLELLEQAESDDDVKFCTVLEIIKHCLLRIPKQRGKSICWVCDSIVKHLCNMDTLKCEDPLDDNDLTFSKNQSEIHLNILSVYEVILEFFLPFIQEIRNNDYEIHPDHLEEYKDNMMKCLIKCLGRPLVNTDLSKGTALHGVATKVLDFIQVFVVDSFNFLQYVDLSFGCAEMLEVDAVSTDFTNVSLGCYFYLIFEDSERLQNTSHVFSPKYLFECAMALAFDLMGTNESLLIFKALKLFNYILDRVSPKTIEFNSIKDTVLSKFLEMITRCMVYSETKEIRQLSVSLFPKFVGKFSPEGQYMILFNASQLSSHPGFIGFAVTLVKEQVREALDNKHPVCLRYFTGKKLIDLLNRYCKITGLVEADLHSHTDQIMSCLNLIRYVLLKDVNNDTELADYFNTVDETYIEPVKKACSFARGLYEDYKAELHKPADKRLQVNIAGSEEILPEMSPSEQLEMMKENLTRVDMIDFLANRVSECLADYKLRHHTVQ